MRITALMLSSACLVALSPGAGLCAGAGPETADDVVSTLVKRGLPAAGLAQLRQRARKAGVSDAEQLQLLGAIYTDEDIPLECLLNKSFEAVSKRIPTPRAVAAICKLRTRLILSRKVLANALGGEPGDDLVVRAAGSANLGLLLKDMARVASTVAGAASGKEARARMKALLELCDEITARGGVSSDVAALAIRVAGRDYSSPQILNIAGSVRRDFADFQHILAKSVIESYKGRIAAGAPFDVPVANGGVIAIPGASGGGRPPHPPRPAHPHGGPPGQAKK